MKSSKNTLIPNDSSPRFEIRFDPSGYAILRHIAEKRYFRIEGDLCTLLANSEQSAAEALCSSITSKNRKTREDRVVPKDPWYFKRIIQFDASDTLKNVMIPSVFCSLWAMCAVIAISIVLGVFALRLQEPGGTHIAIIAAWTFGNIMLHEAGHIATCLNAGRVVGNTGIKLNYGIPMFFVDTSDICMAEKKDRVVTSLGGVCVNSVMLLLLLFINIVTNSSNTPLVLISISLILFNTIPFMKLDGYFILSDLLNVQNLGQRARGELSKFIKSRGKNGNRALTTYGALNIIFIGFVIMFVLHGIETMVGL